MEIFVHLIIILLFCILTDALTMIVDSGDTCTKFHNASFIVV